jgi:hypothetical protein
MTNVELTRKARKPGLAIYAREDMDRELLWFFDNDVLAGGIPANHVVILSTLEKTASRHTSASAKSWAVSGTRKHSRVELGEKRGLLLALVALRRAGAPASRA